MNKSLSDDPDAILAMQGVSWLVRRAIKWSNIRLNVTQYTDGDGLVHIDIEQVSSVATTIEDRTIDWTFREKEDRVFGKVKGRTRWVDVEAVDDEFLRNGWDGKWLEEAKGEVIQAYVESVGKDPNWIADQIWGFESIDGGRRYVRHVVARKGSEVHKIKTVYDWIET